MGQGHKQDNQAVTLRQSEEAPSSANGASAPVRPQSAPKPGAVGLSDNGKNGFPLSSRFYPLPASSNATHLFPYNFEPNIESSDLLFGLSSDSPLAPGLLPSFTSRSAPAELDNNFRLEQALLSTASIPLIRENKLYGEDETYYLLPKRANSASPEPKKLYEQALADAQDLLAKCIISDLPPKERKELEQLLEHCDRPAIGTPYRSKTTILAPFLQHC